MENNQKLHIVMFPWLAFGHMIPYLELSKRLATKGHHIYFVSTPRNLQRLPKIPQNLSTLITLVPLPLPRVENLPPYAEATTDVGFEMGANLLKKAYDGLQEALTKFLEASVASNNPLDWIIYDFTCYWLPPIADKLGIRKVYMSIFNARLLSMLGPSSTEGASGWTDAEMLTRPPPWIPFPNSTVYLLPYEARMMFKGATGENSSGVSDMFRIQICISSSDLVAVRSCFELEAEYLQLLEKLHDKTVIPVGLLPPSVEETHQEDYENSTIFGWLDLQTSGSVVYVAFGSEVEPSQEQLIELALGLELSGLPFLWAFRKSVSSSVELPDGFVERTRNRGLVWTSWVPQLRILRHKSVGGFLTHAGWSSAIETLMFGNKPLIMLPLAVDQWVNARFMEEKGVGIEVPRNKEDGSFTRRSVAETLKLVLQDEAGKMYKDEANKISPIFANESLHNQYIDKLSDYLCEHKSKFSDQ